MEHAHPVRNRAVAVAAILALIVICGALWTGMPRTPKPNDAGKLSVVASFYPLGDFAKAVGGQYVSVSVITPSGAEPHEYEPSPQDIALMRNSTIFLYEGGLEPWTDKLVPELHARGITDIRMTDHISTVIPGDPHAWLDPLTVKEMVIMIKDTLKDADSAHAVAYEANADKYIARLDRLHAGFTQTLSACRTHTIIVSHNAFQYLARRYGIETAYIAGISPDEEPSPRKIADIAALAKDKQVRYIFFETLVSPKIAETVASEAGADTLVLDPIEGLSAKDAARGNDYISIMERNLTSLKTALECQ